MQSIWRWVLATLVVLSTTMLRLAEVAHAEEPPKPHIISITLHLGAQSKTILRKEGQFKITDHGCIVVPVEGHMVMHCGGFTLEDMGEEKDG